MKKLIVFTCLISALLTYVSAQSQGEIRGKVFDKNTKVSIPGANVFVEVNGKKIGTVTDINGNYVIKPLNAGVYNVNITYMGYQEVIVSEVKVNPDAYTFMADVFMSNKPVDIIKGAEIIGYKEELIKKGDPGEIRLPIKQLQAMPDSKNLFAVLRNMSADIKVSDDGRDIYFRGSRSGNVIYIVDGIKQMNPDVSIPSTGIGSLSVYTGGVPAKYGDFTGGVVVIETMSYFDWLASYNARQMNKTN